LPAPAQGAACRPEIAMYLQCATRRLTLDQPIVMGVINVTPDSFSDAGRYATPATALERAQAMVEEGAAIIDIGGVSTRPGSVPVSPEEELARVLPVVERVAAHLPVVISVDTSSPLVMRRAADHGAHMINDVRALRSENALETAAATGLAVCLMHMQGEPATMQRDPSYVDVVAEVQAYLETRIEACFSAGIGADRLCIDPGFGFGKLLRHNIELLRRLSDLARLGPPLLVGLSRKSMAGALAGGEGRMTRRTIQAPAERLAASLALATVAVLNGASIVRAHDVAATVDAVRVAATFLKDRH
jgi:dihydropteroate synthase